MGTKYKRERYIDKEDFHKVIGFRLYKRRNIFFFLFFLCTCMFISSGLLLNKYNLERKPIYTEGIVIEKKTGNTDKNRISSPETIGCWITIEFSLRNGKKVNKTIPLEREFCPHINIGDILSVLYHYNSWKGSIEIASYSRFPIQQGTEQEKN